jgi:hypothetical protein
MNMSISPDCQQQDANQIKLSPKPDRDHTIKYMLAIGAVSQTDYGDLTCEIQIIPSLRCKDCAIGYSDRLN